MNYLKRVIMWVNNNKKLIIAVAAFLTTITPYVAKFVESRMMNVSYESVEFAREQQRLWEKNMDCLTSSAEKVQVVRNDNSTVGITVCYTGDILVDYKTVNNERTMRWVSLDSIRSTGLSASMHTIPGSTVLSVYAGPNNTIIIIEEKDGVRYKTVVDSRTGRVISRTIQE